MKTTLWLLIALVLAPVGARAQECFPEIQCRVTKSVKQTVTSGATLKTNCGSVVVLTAAGTLTVHLPSPSTNNDGCHEAICNVGANTITIAHDTGVLTVGGAAVALAQNECTGFLSTGAAGSWYQTWVTGGTIAADS